MKIFYHAYQLLIIFFNLSTESSHFNPLHGENCDSNSRLVVDEDDNGEFRLEMVKTNNSNYLKSEQWQTAVTAYLKSKQLLLFVFAGQCL